MSTAETTPSTTVKKPTQPQVKAAAPASAPVKEKEPAPVTTTVMTPAETLGDAAFGDQPMEESTAIDVTSIVNSVEADPLEIVERQDLFEEEIVETHSVMVPETLDMPASPQQKWSVNLYSAYCLDCDSLVQNADQVGTSKKCHFTTGNNACPAATISVVYVGLKSRLLARVRKAQESKDPSKINLALQKVHEADEATQSWVYTQLGLIAA